MGSTGGRLITLMVATLAVTSCSSPPRYDPGNSMSPDEARITIRRALEEQPAGFGASDIEVSDSKLRFARGLSRHFGPIPTTSYTESTTFYFESFGSADISNRKRHGHVVRVYDGSGVHRFRVVISDEQRAKRFIDALYILSLAAPAAPQSP